MQEAVKNLQAWKAQLALLQQRLEDELAAARAAFPDEEEGEDDEEEGEDDEEEGEEQQEGCVTWDNKPSGDC